MSTTENFIFPSHETKLEKSTMSPHLSKDSALVAPGRHMLSQELPLSVQSRTLSALCSTPTLANEHVPEEMFCPPDHGPTRATAMPQHDEGSTFANHSLKVGSMQPSPTLQLDDVATLGRACLRR